MNDIDSLVVFWLTDSDGTVTCHRKSPGLSYEASKLCTVVQNDDKWCYKTPASEELEGPYESLVRLQKAFRIKMGATKTH